MLRLWQRRPLFTILLPVHRPPSMLPYAVASVLAQRQRRFELFVLCDGAPDETAAAACNLAAGDHRVRVRVFPKGERHGERYRDEIIRSESRGRYVCQIADDDLWMPGFLDEMGALLKRADFGNLTMVQALRDGRFRVFDEDLADPAVRHRMLSEKFNFFGPTVCGYRRSAYDRLGTGWSPAPADIWSDLFMWRKFLAVPGLRFATRSCIAALALPTPARRNHANEQRAEEMRGYWERIRDPDRRAQLVAEIRSVSV